jgi:hypothetical protein
MYLCVITHRYLPLHGKIVVLTVSLSILSTSSLIQVSLKLYFPGFSASYTVFLALAIDTYFPFFFLQNKIEYYHTKSNFFLYTENVERIIVPINANTSSTI